MPGKLGDLLYSLPTARHISKIFGTKIDFWTSKFCGSALPLLKAQSYINDAFVSQKYVPQHDNCGVQPWSLEPESQYDKVYHLGFRSYPQCRLVDYFPTIYGFTMVDTAIKYDIPEHSSAGEVVIVPGRNPLLKPYFIEILEKLPKELMIVQCGPKEELIKVNLPNVNYCCDIVDALCVMDNAKLFIGTLSANLVLANGFPNLKKVILIEKERHNPVHDIQSQNHYYVEPKNALQKIMDIVRWDDSVCIGCNKEDCMGDCENYKIAERIALLEKSNVEI